MESISQYPPITVSIVGILLVAFVSWLVSIVKFRLGYRYLHGDLPSPPFSLWFGSIPVFADMFKTSPMDTHPMLTMTLIYRKYKLGPIYFLDNWPFAADRIMVVNDPDIAAQVTQQRNLPKHRQYPFFLAHVAGNTSMVSVNGAPWKKARSLFNPGFALTHLMTLVPTIVDDTLIYVKRLDQLAKSQEIKPLDHIVSELTIDIMGHITLDHNLNSQISKNALIAAFRNAVYWSPGPSNNHPIFSINPVRSFWQWYYTRQMDDYIRKVIDHRISKRASEGIIVPGEKKSPRRPGIDLAIEEFLLTDNKNGVVSEEFMQVAIDQMKTFLFAGHDTTASALCYIYHMLDTHPEAMEKIRAEHDRIFGNAKEAAENIKKNPILLNDMPYTTAVIKETLRLFPAAATTREGAPGFSVTCNGISYPTDGCMVLINVHNIHRREDLFPNADSFIPERFLPAPDNFQNVVKDSWRPFEKGARNCIGQELAMLEMKIVLVTTIRQFAVKSQYEEWDRMLGREKPGDMLDGKRGMFGLRAYQVMRLLASPSDGMPVSVNRRN